MIEGSAAFAALPSHREAGSRCSSSVLVAKIGFCLPYLNEVLEVLTVGSMARVTNKPTVSDQRQLSVNIMALYYEDIAALGRHIAYESAVTSGSHCVLQKAD